MKKLLLLGSVFLGFCTVQAQYRYVEPSRPMGFVRMNMGAMIAGGSNWGNLGPIKSGDAAFTMGLEGGVLLGSDQEHEISFGFSGFGWDENYEVGSGGHRPYYRMNYSQTYTPFVFGYAYNLGLGHDKQFKIYAGPLVGFSIVEAIESEHTGGWYYWYDDWSSDSRIAFTYGGQVGIRWVINQLFELTLGYRFMRIQGGSLDTYDTGRVSTPHMNMHGILFMFGARF